jgi:hypothetical protein
VAAAEDDWDFSSGEENRTDDVNDEEILHTSLYQNYSSGSGINHI